MAPSHQHPALPLTTPPIPPKTGQIYSTGQAYSPDYPYSVTQGSRIASLLDDLTLPYPTLHPPAVSRRTEAVRAPRVLILVIYGPASGLIRADFQRLASTLEHNSTSVNLYSYPRIPLIISVILCVAVLG